MNTEELNKIEKFEDGKWIQIRMEFVKIGDIVRVNEGKNEYRVIEAPFITDNGRWGAMVDPSTPVLLDKFDDSGYYIKGREPE